MSGGMAPLIVNVHKRPPPRLPFPPPLIMLTAAAAAVASYLECSICNYSFDETAHLPRNLPCGHRFCTACLASWVKRKAEAKYTITCPIDGAEINVKNGDATTLATNYGMLPLISAALRPPAAPTLSEPGDVACELCEEKHDATHRCLDCQQGMCQCVAKQHRRLSGTMSHRVVTLAEWQSNPSVAAIIHLCKAHGKPADLFDLDCGLLLCGQCVLSHVDHAARIHPVAKASTVCRAELDAWIGRFEHWDTRITATDKACDVRGDEVQSAHGRAQDLLVAEEKTVCACRSFPACPMPSWLRQLIQEQSNL
jgi:hypothetical protein